MLNINTNISSMIVQKNLTNSTNLLNQAIERMSTGYKINHASDNAANYSISTNLTTEIGAYSIAQDNISMGLDMVTTAQDTISLMQDHVGRIRDLCVQARNGTYGVQSLQAIQTEANARISEITRLYTSAEFNGIKLFDNKAISDDPSMPKAGASGFIDEDFERITPDVVVTDPTQLLSAIENNTTIGIANAETLAELAKIVNGTDGYTANGCYGKTITLTQDIDLSAYSTGEGWTPIGNMSVYFFNGTFDGQGHKVSNLYINRPAATMFRGLFGLLMSAEIKNLGVENCDVTGSDYVGGLAGECDGTITNCYVTGNVTGNNCVGGLAGDCRTITNCYVTGNVTGNRNVGGLAGACLGIITNCYAAGNVTGNNCVGGLAGGCYGITNCYAAGNVTGNDKVGGLAGSTAENVINSISYSQSVTGTSNIGSFVGSNNGTCTNCKCLDIGIPKVGYGVHSGIEFIELQNESTTLQVGINSDNSCQITFDTNFSLDISGLSVTSDSALSTIDNFISQLSTKSVELGSVQNRLESALESTSVSIENLTKTRSTIKDADIAQVSSDYIKQQILQQASATLLSTTNQSPAIALTLLGGIR